MCNAQAASVCVSKAVSSFSYGRVLVGSITKVGASNPWTLLSRMLGEMQTDPEAYAGGYSAGAQPYATNLGAKQTG